MTFTFLQDSLPTVLLSADARRRRVLQQESRHGHDRLESNAATPTPAEQATLSVAAHTAQRVERRHARWLDRAGRTLVAATGHATAVRGRTEILLADPVREHRSKAFDRAEQAGLERAPDLRRPAIPARLATALEIAVPVMEYFWWHQTWGRDADQSKPWWSQERIGVALLALMIPLLGVYLAHATGVLLQRVVRHRETASTGDRIGSVVLGLLTVIASVAIFRLVSWRYGAGAGLGALPIPAAPLAWVFVMLLFLVVTVRAFCDSEQTRRHRELGRQVAAERKQDSDALAAVAAVDTAVGQAWRHGVDAVDRCLNDVDQVFATVAVLLNDHWAVTGRNPSAAVGGAAGRPATPAEITVSRMGFAGRLPEGWELALSLRHVRRQLDLLADLRPAELTNASARLEQLRQRVARMENWPEAELPAPAAAKLRPPAPNGTHRDVDLRLSSQVSGQA